MVKQVVNERDTYSTRTVDIIRVSAVIVPLLVLVYGLLGLHNLVSHSPLLTMQTYLWVVSAFVVLGIGQLLLSRELYARLIPAIAVLYTLVAAAYAIYVGGFSSPALFSWIVLLIACDIFFGRFWLIVDAAFMTLTSIYGYTLLPDAPVKTLINYVCVSVFVAIVGLVLSALRDVQAVEHADLKKTREEEAHQRESLLSIINGASQAIFTVGPRGTIRIYNAALLDLLDTNDSLSGKNVDDVMHLFAGEEGEAVSLRALMDSSRIDRDDLVLKFGDGDTINLHITGNKLQGAYSASHPKDSGGYTFIVRDITKQKSLDEERDEFISVVSHELRTPVTIAEGTISNVQYFMQNGSDPTKLSASLDSAHEQILLLANMINDLGTLSRAERGVGDQTEEIDVQELIKTLYASYNESASKKKLALNLDVGTKLGSVTTSRLYLEELLQNLITNAIKYTQEGSVTISVHRTAAGLDFAVKDTGIGMSKTDLKHIFEKFYRSEDYRTRETSGTGLGLYVVHKLMRKLGTKVEVKSRLNHGSTFSFVIPTRPTKTRA